VILDRAGEQADARIKESGADPVEIHIDDTSVIEPTLPLLGRISGCRPWRRLVGHRPHPDRRALVVTFRRVGWHFSPLRCYRSVWASGRRRASVDLEGNVEM